MTTILLLLGGLLILAGGVLVFQAFHAPMGHEDNEGFHFEADGISPRNPRATYTVQIAHRSAHAGTQQRSPAT